MIHATEGYVKIEGTLPEIMADFTRVIEAFYETVSRDLGDTFAREVIVKAGQLAFMTDEEMQEEHERIKNQWEN